MFKSHIRAALPAAIAAMLIIPAAAPAVAAAPEKGEAASSATSATTARAESKKYCLSPTVTRDQRITGSLLPRKKECHTREEWEAAGINIDGK